MELIRRFPPDLLSRALADWAWMPALSGKSPMVTSAFGDVFLTADDGVWFLDTLEGTLTREWDSPASLQDVLNTQEGQDRFLMVGLAQTAFSEGRVPGDGEVLSFKTPPILGGSLEPDNIEVSDLEVALSVAGQIHRQVKDVPPGTPVSGITIDGHQP